ncbi:hypothetical protein M422DRAFT_35865 [Sphaerobolus stellatus SS14]|uniref:DUF6533 domain-containing protein n=1 Tax=Sphaerobolus stellatus (strain SS14) TaxID=990650 RepID=A0A0C9USU4_SPHS4|nr:hypothetical protein M422DRAFT_35865 [Sphaerobolus stellatus SS14]
MFVPTIVESISSFLEGESALIFNIGIFCCPALFFWDFLLTIEEEYRLVWARKKFGIVTILFFLIRYSAVALRVVSMVVYTDALDLMHPTAAHCMVWAWWEVVAGHLLFTCVELLLIMRVYAFYGQNNKLLFIIFILWLVEHGASLAIAGISLPKFIIVGELFPKPYQVGKCTVTYIPGIFQTYWIFALIFHGILFFLLFGRFFYPKWNTRISTTHLLFVFLRDGAWAFVTIFGMVMYCALAFELNPQAGDIALTWMFTSFGVVGTRLVLNLRSMNVSDQPLQESVQMNNLYVLNSLPNERSVSFVRRVTMPDIGVNRFTQKE